MHTFTFQQQPGEIIERARTSTPLHMPVLHMIQVSLSPTLRLATLSDTWVKTVATACSLGGGTTGYVWSKPQSIWQAEAQKTTRRLDEWLGQSGISDIVYTTSESVDYSQVAHLLDASGTGEVARIKMNKDVQQPHTGVWYVRLGVLVVVLDRDELAAAYLRVTQTEEKKTLLGRIGLPLQLDLAHSLSVLFGTTKVDGLHLATSLPIRDPPVVTFLPMEKWVSLLVVQPGATADKNKVHWHVADVDGMRGSLSEGRTLVRWVAPTGVAHSRVQLVALLVEQSTLQSTMVGLDTLAGSAIQGKVLGMVSWLLVF